MQSGSIIVSLFKKNKYSAKLCFAPKLHPPAYPKFFEDSIIFNVGYFSMIFDILESLLALSTIIISKSLSV